MIVLLQFDILPTHHVLPAMALVHEENPHRNDPHAPSFNANYIRIYKANPHSLIFKWKWLPIKCFPKHQVEDNFNNTPNGYKV